MTAYISQKEADELCAGMLCDYYAKWKQTDIPVCIDIIEFGIARMRMKFPLCGKRFIPYPKS